MAALTSSLAPSLASEYAPANGWLTLTTNPTGKGPVTTGPSEAISDPRNGTAPVDLNPPAFSPGNLDAEFAVQAPDYLDTPATPLVGPWPPIPAYGFREREPLGDGKEPFGELPLDGIDIPGYYKVPEDAEGFAFTEQVHPGHDRHGRQVTDDAGWEQYTPSGRVAVRQLWKQHYPGVDPFWPLTQGHPARSKPARGANQMVHGVVAQYGDLANSGGSTVYEAPPPAAMTTQPPATGVVPIPQWGF